MAILRDCLDSTGTELVGDTVISFFVWSFLASHDSHGFEFAKARASSWVGVAVGFPLAWGIFKTVEKAATLFR
jgi:hypothetical protein